MDFTETDENMRTPTPSMKYIHDRDEAITTPANVTATDETFGITDATRTMTKVSFIVKRMSNSLLATYCNQCT